MRPVGRPGGSGCLVDCPPRRFNSNVFRIFAVRSVMSPDLYKFAVELGLFHEPPAVEVPELATEETRVVPSTGGLRTPGAADDGRAGVRPGVARKSSVSDVCCRD